jgi:hypothetical protein
MFRSKMAITRSLIFNSYEETAVFATIIKIHINLLHVYVPLCVSVCLRTWRHTHTHTHAR